ncbi:septum site-determining protein MinC [Metallibacterium sp.]|uniref:septum site-determining protein MinC n=1 Tax=Metallibacterium sp. TaxID=2940281 RepID=UPI00261C5BD7|nr:septum site-determining protein MinC [Metallibacterium sp.]
MAAKPAGDSVCDLRFGQVGIANVRVTGNDPAALQAALAERVHKAPQLFARAAVVLDLGHLPQDIDRDATAALLDAVRAAGMLPVALAYGTRHIEALAEALNLPLIAKFRAAYEPAQANTAAAAAPESTPTPRRARAAEAEVAPAAVVSPTAASAPTLHHAQAVRSGQQVYAEARDLVVTANVAAGAEVISDGSIHIYGSLRGRALAGAGGNEQARIYCQTFHAELVSIAGRYRTFEEIPDDLEGRAVQCWLEGEKLLIARLDR